MEKYDNSGALFVNDKKQTDKHPDRTGSATIDGTEYWVSGWLKKGAKGPFLSLAFKAKDASTKPEGGGLSGSRPRSATPIDDDIPFMMER